MFLEPVEVLTRILLAVLAGGAVGFEREKRGRDAGFRTHLLVAIGACIFTLIELEGIDSVMQSALSSEDAPQVITVSMHRLTAQIISGIGFLGAGTIIVTKRSVQGLTTAASIWVCAALGMAAGYGYYVIVGLGVITILLVLIVIKRLFAFPHLKILTVKYHGQEGLKDKLEAYLELQKAKIIQMNSKTSITGKGLWHDIDFHVDTSKISSLEAFLQEIRKQGDFEEITILSSSED